MTPGGYLRQCREAAGLTREAVAMSIDSEPPVCVRRRVEWIEDIERGAAPIALPTALELGRVFPFDLMALGELCAAHPGPIETIHDLRMCFVAEGRALSLAAQATIAAHRAWAA